MNKVILMSIQPKWLAKIANGEKRVDIRKTIPNCALPIDVYLCCTKGTLYFNSYENEWQTSKVDRRLLNPNLQHCDGKVVAKFTLNKVDQVVYIGSAYTVDNNEARTNAVARKSCLDFKDLHTYLKGEDGYAWHIDDLVVLNEPKELSEFYGVIHYPNGEFLTPDICNYGEGYEEDEEQCLKSFRIKRAPQSWQYAYVKEKEND